ncbi:MAG TPA: glycosyltransferase family 1 protein, partial [Rhodocyclaceae bacterium]|nr:glycosyltransferase family 1 protein [Rhodocyclaceae bacterium]
LKPFEALMYEWYRARPPKTFVKWVRQADFIFLESGIAPIFFDLISRANPRAETIYIASDDLSTIRVADFVHKCFNEAAPKMSALCLPSRALADNMPSSHNKFYVPHGIDLSIKNDVSTNPYVYGINAVSVGSMLFDPEFFVAASKSFPNITFHVIGSGHPPHPEYGRNVKVYDEMPYRQTLRYIKHATFGIAPYSAASVPAYLADTSMKLMQYDFFGLPAICPQSVVGRYSTRFGYTPGDADSIRRAIQRALRSKRASVQKYLSWSDVTSRLLTPGRFSDTRI